MPCDGLILNVKHYCLISHLFFIPVAVHHRIRTPKLDPIVRCCDYTLNCLSNCIVI